MSQQVKSKSEKFPPAHEDGVVGFPLEPSGQSNLSTMITRHLVPTTMSSLASQSGPIGSSSGNIGNRVGRRRKKSSMGGGGEDGRPRRPPSRGTHMATMSSVRNHHENDSASTGTRNRGSHLKPQVPEEPAAADGHR